MTFYSVTLCNIPTPHTYLLFLYKYRKCVSIVIWNNYYSYNIIKYWLALFDLQYYIYTTTYMSNYVWFIKLLWHCNDSYCVSVILITHLRLNCEQILTTIVIQPWPITNFIFSAMAAILDSVRTNQILVTKE